MHPPPLFLLSPPPPPPRADIPTSITTVPTSVREAPGGVTLLTHDLFTNDVLYLDVALDLRPVPTELLPLLPLFSRWAGFLFFGFVLSCW